MNWTKRRLYLPLIALLAAGCYAGERYETTIERRWPAATVRSLELVETNGNVSVSAGSGSDITLVAHVRSRGIAPQRNAENQGFFESEISGGSLRIGQKRPKVQVSFPFFDGPHVSIDYRLNVPAAMALELKTVNGHIEARGVAGQTQLTTVNGPIDVEIVGSEELSAKTVNGAVHATFLQDFRGARLKTVNGAVEAVLPQSASFTCDLSQVNGDFEASFPLSIHSNPGLRRVSGAVNGGSYELQITTVNGDVGLQHLAPPAPPAVPPAGVTPPAAPPQPPTPVS